MSGAEVLGLIASAGQVVEIGILFMSFISTTYDRFKNTSGSIEHYLHDARHLLNITECIKEACHQQNPTAYAYVTNIQLEAKELTAVLDCISEKYRRKSTRAFWQAVTGREEKRILALFEKLERAKVGLTLCLVCCNTTSLQIIKSSVDRIEEAMYPSTKTKDWNEDEKADLEEASRGDSSSDAPFWEYGPHSQEAVTASRALVPVGSTYPGSIRNDGARQAASSNSQKNVSQTKPINSSSSSQQPDSYTGHIGVMLDVQSGDDSEVNNGALYIGFDGLAQIIADRMKMGFMDRARFGHRSRVNNGKQGIKSSSGIVGWLKRSTTNESRQQKS